MLGELDRAKLGLEIFSDVEKKKLLNSITHPDIHGEMKKQVLKYFLKGKLSNFLFILKKKECYIYV